MDDELLRTQARLAAETLLDFESPSLVGGGIDIYDPTGPLIFVDYLLEDIHGRLGWVRTMPDAAGSAVGPVVSAQTGKHPAVSALAQISPERVLGPSLRPIRQRARRQSFEAFNKHLIPSDKGMSASPSPAGFLVRAELTKTLEKVFGEHNRPTLVCYHYPEIGLLGTDSQSGEQYVVDVADKRRFNLSESGNAVADSESRVPYSFLNSVTERGDPGQFDVPQDEFSISTFRLIGQEKDNWCAAASCQMILAHHGIEQSQASIAQAMRIPQDPNQGGAGLNGQVEAFRQLGPTLTSTPDATPVGVECIGELVARRPVKNGIFQHAQVIAGWKRFGASIHYLIYDPLPVGMGAVKYQNPRIIHSINFITARPGQP